MYYSKCHAESPFLAFQVSGQLPRPFGRHVFSFVLADRFQQD